MISPRNLTFALGIFAIAAAGVWFLASPLTAEAACTATLSYGDTVDCDISVANEVDTFTFSGADGERVLIRAYEVDQHLDLHITLKDPSSGTVCSDQTVTFQLDTECNLSATGTFSIDVWSDDTDTGDYLLYIVRTSDPPSPAATSISYGDVTSATMGQMEWHAFEFEATAGEELVITVEGTSGSVDPWMYLRTAGGSTFCSASGAGTNGKLCTIGTTGTHHVWIQSWQGHQSGTFDLYVARISDPTTEVVSWHRYDQTLSRSLDALHYNPHRFFAENGDVVEVDVNATSGNLIWLLRVYRPSGTLMCQASGYNHVDPECTVTSTGVHTAWVSAWDPSSTAVYDTKVSLVGLDAPRPSDTGHRAFDPSYPVVAPSTGFSHEQTDVAIPGKGVPLSFTRYYRSGSAVDRSLGLGWTHSYDVHLGVGSEAVEVYYPQGHSTTFSFDPNGDLFPVNGVTDDLVKHLDDTLTLTTKGQVRYEFDAGGVLRSIRDRNGLETELFYDVNGDLDYVEDPGGRRLDFTVDANGRITRIDVPLSRSVQYAYNGNGELTTFTDLLSGTTTYAYGTYGMTSITDPRSNVAVSNGYDTDGRLREQKNALNKSTCTYYGYGPSYSSTACTGVSPAAGSNEVVIVDAEGNASRFGWGPLHRTTTITDALDGVTTNVFDSLNNVTSVTNPLNQTTSFTYDQDRNVLTQTDALNQTWTYTYNSFNDVLTATDPRSKVTTYAYDASGNLTSVTDAATNVTTFTVDLEGLVTKVTDARLNETDYTYDTYGNRATVTNQLDDVWTYTYDAGSRLTKVRDPLLHDVDYTYNNGDQVLTVTNHLSEVTTNVYDANGNLTSVTDAETNATTYTYDAANRLTKITDDLAQETTYAYDDVGNQTSVTNVRNKTTSYLYDALYRRTKVTDPLNRVTEYEYDAVGNQTRRTDARDLVTDYTYDAVNQLTEIKHLGVAEFDTVWFDDSLPAGAVATGTWAWAPAPQSGSLSHQSALQSGTHQTYFDGATTTLAVNTGDTLVAYVYLDPDSPPTEIMVQWNDGSWEHRAYWGANSIPWGVDGTDSRRYVGALPTTGEWIRLEVPASQVGLEGSTVDGIAFALYGGRAWWDAAGKEDSGGTDTVWVDDALPAGATPSGTWDWAPGPESGSSSHRSILQSGAHQHYFKSATETIEVETGDTLIAYVHLDPDDPPTEVMLQWHQNGSWEHRAYWGANSIPWGVDGTNSRRYVGTLPTTGEWVRLEVPASQVGLEGSTVDGMAFTLYGGRGSWDSARKAGTTAITTYEYDTAGNRTSVTDSTGETTYTYDDLNRITKVTFPDADEFDYTYDANGNRTQIAYPDTKHVDYTYDAANQLSTVTDWLSNVTTYAYDDAGRLTSTTYPTTVVATYTYDDADRLLSVTNKRGGVTISSHTYTLDDVGNRTQVVDNQGTTTYAYDDLYRLTSVTYPGPTTDTYTYDPLGNRLTKNTIDYTYDDADQLTDVEGTTYTYDANGNLTARGTDTFTWDRENRMLKADVGGNVSTFVYNADGVRVQQKNEGGTIDYEVDVVSPLPLVMQDDEYSYVYGLDLISAVDGSANEAYYLYDGLGSVAALTDDSGVETDSYVYDAFGAVTSSTGTTSNDWLFTGEQRDGDTDLYFLRARYYDPEIGRFLGRDPLEFAQRYAYAGNNPVAYTDPSGLEYQSTGGYSESLSVPIISRLTAIWRTRAKLNNPGPDPISSVWDAVIGGLEITVAMESANADAEQLVSESVLNPSCWSFALSVTAYGAGAIAASSASPGVIAVGTTVVLVAGVGSVLVDVGVQDGQFVIIDTAAAVGGRVELGELTGRGGYIARRIGPAALAVSGGACLEASAEHILNQ